MREEQARLSSTAVAAWRELLAQPMTPGQLAEHAQRLKELLGDAFITSPASTWARESQLGARFATALDARSVWLQEKPDLVVVGADNVPRRYELTEVLEPRRRRNDEYREDRIRASAGDSAARWYVPDNVDSTRDALRGAAAAKAKKASSYGSEAVGLLIYLNTDLHAFDECTTTLEANLHQETLLAAKVFSEVWVLWAGRLYLVWRDGVQVELRPKLGI